jgi:hypothetical protein
LDDLEYGVLITIIAIRKFHIANTVALDAVATENFLTTVTPDPD